MALDSDKHKLSIILKVVIPVAIVVILAVVISVLLLFRRRKQMARSISLPSFGRKIPKISYSDLFRATEGFATSNLVGQGRYGSVYQGKLCQDGNVVAIKVFNLETRGAQKSFIAECDALRNVRHRNLVPILTACSSIDSNGNDFKALVYEFMPRGDLHNLLYSTRESEGSSYLNCIPLNQRLSILVDVSDALAYLHHSHQGTIVHCDLKPSNIGLARFKFSSATSSAVDSYSTSTAAIKGTIGYVAPGIVPNLFFSSEIVEFLHYYSVYLNQTIPACNLQNAQGEVTSQLPQMSTASELFSSRYSSDGGQQMTCSGMG